MVKRLNPPRGIADNGVDAELVSAERVRECESRSDDSGFSDGRKSGLRADFATGTEYRKQNSGSAEKIQDRAKPGRSNRLERKQFQDSAGFGDYNEIKCNNNKGFTLAETLIALVVIGIIAAITVPNLITDYQKNATVERLKKVYSTLSQTTNRAIADNGPIDSWDVTGMNAKQFATTFLTPYLSIIKECNSQNQSECNFKYYNFNDRTNLHTLSYNNADYMFFLADGSEILVKAPIVNSSWGTSSQIFVDINGNTPPNVLGKDVFEFIYWINHATYPQISGTFMPYGGQLSRNNVINGLDYSCRRDKTCALCAALIMKDGWKISDDYPR